MHVKKPGIRRGKIDLYLVTNCIFLGFASTKRNAIYYDSSIRETKTSHHYVIDKAYDLNNTTCPVYTQDILDTIKTKLSIFQLPYKASANTLTLVIPNLYLTNTYNPLLIAYTLLLKDKYSYFSFDLLVSDTKCVVIVDITKNTIPYSTLAY